MAVNNCPTAFPLKCSYKYSSTSLFEDYHYQYANSKLRATDRRESSNPP